MALAPVKNNLDIIKKEKALFDEINYWKNKELRELAEVDRKSTRLNSSH